MLAAVACDTNRPSLDPATAPASLNGVGMVLDLPTVALTLGVAGSTLHAVRPTTQGADTVAAVWHSSDEQVVSVDAAGHLTARGVGSASIWAIAGRDSVSSAITVSPPGPSFGVNAATISIRPSAARLSVGVPQQFSASVQAPMAATTVSASAVPSGPLVKWTSSAPRVAAVSSNGTVVPIAPGIALITATALGSRATSTVIVSRERATTSRIDLAVMRFDGGSGPVMVSNGIPFPRGLVTESTLNQVHLYVNGAEHPLFTRALGGRWPDGSLRAALVQFDFSIPDARTIPAYLTVVATRTMAAPAERAATPTPVAAALPTSSSYLISTGIGGMLYDPATNRSATMLIAQYESDFTRIAALDWAKCGANADWSCGRTAGYDRAFTLYQAWVRTANPTYWQHATTLVAKYINGYLVPARGAIAPWWSMTESTALHYWATGDERTRGYLDAVASELIYQVRPEGGWGLGNVPAQYGDDRDRAKVLIALMDARMIDAKPTPTGTPRGRDTPFFMRVQGQALALRGRVARPVVPAGLWRVRRHLLLGWPEELHDGDAAHGPRPLSRRSNTRSTHPAGRETCRRLYVRDAVARRRAWDALLQRRPRRRLRRWLRHSQISIT